MRTEVGTNFLSTSGLARAVQVSENTVRDYADKGLIPHFRDQSGRRIFPIPEAVTKAKAALAARTR